MPLSINVGLSRKASKDYQSTGFSINVTAELDQALLTRPEELQRQIDELYRQADQAIDRQVNAHGRTGRHALPSGSPQTSASAAASPPRSTPSPRHAGSMTQSQRRAIDAMAQRLGIDPGEEARHEFGWSWDQLSIRQASSLIDHLKTLSPTASSSSGKQQ